MKRIKNDIWGIFDDGINSFKILIQEGEEDKKIREEREEFLELALERENEETGVYVRQCIRNGKHVVVDNTDQIIAEEI